MHYLSFLYPALLASATLFDSALALGSGTKIKLSKVQSLTLRAGQKTSHRRVPAIPQVPSPRSTFNSSNFLDSRLIDGS